MHLLFIDESGTAPPPGKQGHKFFVLAGLVVPEAVWKKLASDFSEVKNRWCITGEIKWRHFSPMNQSEDNSLIHLDAESRFAVREELFAAMTQYKSIRFIAVAADIGEAYKQPYIQTKEHLYWICHKQITERFQYHLQDQGRDVGAEINGIVVIDHRGAKDDQRLRTAHDSLVFTDSMYTAKYANLIEGLFVAPSHLSVGIQCADLVAGAVFRFVEKGDDRFFNQLLPNFRKSRLGKLEGYGLVQWPKR